MPAAICESHRKELLRFLLLKTAAVRNGVKPGELLRVRHCYSTRNAGGFQFCLYRKDIFDLLRLDYLELRTESDSSLVLFYHPSGLADALACPENRAVLRQCGYAETASPADRLAELKRRFSSGKLPHEVGVFIGYPAKDVAGFMADLPRTPVHRGDWQVFGDARESLRRMALYRRVERAARRLLDVCEDLPTFFDRITRLNFNFNSRSPING